MYLKYFLTNRGKGVKLRWRMLLINVSIGKALILVFRTDKQILSNHYRIKESFNEYDFLGLKQTFVERLLVQRRHSLHTKNGTMRNIGNDSNVLIVIIATQGTTD